jgi:hypothetical protein
MFFVMYKNDRIKNAEIVKFEQLCLVMNDTLTNVFDLKSFNYVINSDYYNGVLFLNLKFEDCNYETIEKYNLELMKQLSVKTDN